MNTATSLFRRVLLNVVRKQIFVPINKPIQFIRAYGDCGVPKALLLVDNGFEEIEAIVTLELLRRAGVNVTLASITEGEIRGLNKLKIIPDKNLSPCDETYDAIIITGGNCSVEKFKKSDQIGELLKKQADSCKIIAAMCSAPVILKQFQIFQNKCLTSHPSVKCDLSKDYNYKEEDVVVDGKLITSRGPGTAHLFALTLIVELVGAQKAKQVAEACLYPHS